MNRKRYSTIDILRGITIISMILYHGMWDIVYIHNVDIPWFDSLIGGIWQQSIAWSFVLMSGFCFSFGKKRIKSGLVLLLCSGVITLVTVIFMPQQKIMFGVLTMLGSCVLIVHFFEKILEKINDIVGVISSIIVFLFLKNISSGYVGIEGLFKIQMPKVLYINILTTYLGLPYKGFWSMDYYGVLPWIFLYIVGFYLYKFCERKKYMDNLDKIHIMVLELVGKHSLIIYMLHQPIVYAILSVVFYIMRRL